MFSCQKVRYRTFFLYSGRVFLSKSTVPYLFSLFLFLFSGMRVAIYETPRPHEEVQDAEHGTQRKRYGTARFGMVLGALLRIRDPVPFLPLNPGSTKLVDLLVFLSQYSLTGSRPILIYFAPNLDPDPLILT